MGARKEQKLNFQTISLNAILVDQEIQSRVEVDMEWVNTLGNIVASGIKLPPIDVFRDPALAKNKRIYLLANGFHRITLARKNGDVAIDAIIHEGDRRDAILLGIDANRGNGKALTPADRKKAACMLLRDPEWTNWSEVVLAKRAGVATGSIVRWRAELGIEPSERIIKSSGVTQSRPRKRKGEIPVYHTRQRGNSIYGRVSIDGKEHYLGSDGQEARQKFNELVNNKFMTKNVSLESCNSIQKYLASHGFVFSGKWVKKFGPEFTIGLSSLRGHDCLIVLLTTQNFDELRQAVGNVAVASRLDPVNRELRKVILCYLTDLQVTIIDKLRDIDGGIEFMTPEDFVDDLKVREGKS